MKKLLFITITFFLLNSFSAKGQVMAVHALGLRIGDNAGPEVEVSYQQAVWRNRLEFDLGINTGGYYEGFKFSTLYQWVFEIGSGFNWYAGAGGAIGFWHIHDGPFEHGDYYYDEAMFLDASGQIGVEYNCRIPLQISLDMRPEIGIINDDFDIGVGLGLRYQF